MPSFLIAFHQPPPLTADQSKALMARGTAWIESLGSAVTGPLTPLGASTWLGGEGGTPLAGFMVIAAEDLAAVTRLAEHSPHLGVGGVIEIAPVLDGAFNPV